MKISVNDEIYNVDVDPNMPLLWVLRDMLKQKGTKYGCGKGLCGSCTVLIDGVPGRSCVIPINSMMDKKITTIEGLSKNNDHPLQVAWREENVPQCGYCQPGQIMNAAGLLNSNKTPNREEIRTAMSGNLCRCGTYGRIEKAIEKVSKNL